MRQEQGKKARRKLRASRVGEEGPVLPLTRRLRGRGGHLGRREGEGLCREVPAVASLLQSIGGRMEEAICSE